MKNTAENVAIYWGAFNPPTLAHIQVVEEVLKTSEISHVIISPSWEREDKDFGISNTEREKLVSVYIKLLQDAWLCVSLDSFFFRWMNQWLTTTKAEEEYFRKKLWTSPYFIFWSDVANDMPDWSGNTDKFIEEKLRKIFLNRPWYEFDFWWNWFDNYILLDIPDMLGVSSSMAREIIQTKWSIKWILHPEIESVVERENLYI
jgi:nicotinic acid mononucleotide adenylyltransferase